MAKNGDLRCARVKDKRYVRTADLVGKVVAI